jgi:hypothetical protein
MFDKGKPGFPLLTLSEGAGGRSNASGTGCVTFVPVLPDRSCKVRQLPARAYAELARVPAFL